MKAPLRHILAAAAVAVMAVLFALVLSGTRRERSRLDCRALAVEIADSSRMRFVSPADVRAYLKDSVVFIGRRLDSIDLTGIERLLDHKSAVRKSEAWLSDNGTLHIRITQREPAVRFQQGERGFYADSEGYLFPLSHYSARLVIVDGAVPLRFGAGFKGEPESPEERAWLRGILDMAAYMAGSRIWSENIAQITVRPDGDLILIPRTGGERFLFGPPQRIREKFDKMRDYYEYIAPSKEAGHYRTVNVKYKGQIICRQ